LLTAGLTLAAPTAVSPAPRSAPASAGAQQAALRLPLSFEANEGQYRADVNFVARAGGRVLAVESTAAELRLPGAGRGAVIRLQAVDADPRATARGVDRLPGVVNHLVGNDPGAWRTGIRTYRSTVTSGVWPGVDLTWHGQGNSFEYDLTLAPGADPAAARFDITGARSVSVTPTGDLAVRSAAGLLTQRAPVAYQMRDGQRQPVDAGYRKLGAHRIGFRVGPHDPTRPVVIDPTLWWSTFVGGPADDVAFDLTVDSTGATYLTGFTSSTSGFPGMGTASYDRYYDGGASDAFVTKINPAGTAVVWSTYLGGSDADRALGIAVDATGASYITGYTQSTTFSGVSSKSIQKTHMGPLRGQDGFLIKLAATGRTIVYGTFLGGTGYDEPRAISLDAANNAYITGGTTSVTFTGVTARSLQPINKGVFNAFLTKVNAAGTAVVYSTFLGGNGNDNAASVVVDGTGAAYLTGGATSGDFTGMTAQSLQRANAGGLEDGFVVKINPTGTGVVWATYLGGSGADEPIRMVIDATGACYVVGSTDSSTFTGVTTAALQPHNAGGQYDAFVTKLGPTGALVWSTYLGGPGNDLGTAIVLDPTGNIWLTGATNSPAWPGIGATSPQRTMLGASNAFLTELAPAGNAVTWSTYLGQGGVTQGMSVRVDRAGDLYVVGATSSPTFTGVLATAPRRTNPGGHIDGFVTKFRRVP
jgi:hypothetical protein